MGLFSNIRVAPPTATGPMHVFLEKIPISPSVDHWAIRVGDRTEGEASLVYECEKAQTGGCICKWGSRSGVGDPTESLDMGITTMSHEQIQNFCAEYTAKRQNHNAMGCNSQRFVQALHARLGCQNKLPFGQATDVFHSAGVVAAEVAAAKAAGGDAGMTAALSGALLGAALNGGKGARLGGALGAVLGIVIHQVSGNNRASDNQDSPGGNNNDSNGNPGATDAAINGDGDNGGPATPIVTLEDSPDGNNNDSNGNPTTAQILERVDLILNPPRDTDAVIDGDGSKSSENV